MSVERTKRATLGRACLALLVLQAAAGATASGFSFAFSPDSTRVVTFDPTAYLKSEPKSALVFDSTASLWDARTGKPIATLRGHGAALVSACFSPDGDRVLTASQDTTARLWDGRTGAPIATLQGGKYALAGAIFSPDGKRIVTRSDDGPARLWDGRTGKLLATLPGEPGIASAASFSPDGTRLLTGGRNAVALWDAASGNLVTKLKPPAGRFDDIREVRFSPDGTRIAVGDGTSFEPILWDGRTGLLSVTLGGAPRGSNRVEAFFKISSEAFSPDGARIVVAADRGTYLLDGHTGKPIATIAGAPKVGEYPIGLVRFSSDGERIVTANIDRSVALWDGRTGGRIAALQGASPEAQGGSMTGNMDLAWSPDRMRIVTVDATAAVLRDVATGKPIASLPMRSNEGLAEDVPPAVAFSPDGERFVTRSDDRNSARLWDGRSGKLVATLTGHRQASP